MAKAKAQAAMPARRAGYGMGGSKMWMGILIFIFGLVKYLGYGWEYAFMAVGVLLFLKGLYCYGKKC